MINSCRDGKDYTSECKYAQVVKKMRPATAEEIDSVQKYIHSISRKQE